MGFFDKIKQGLSKTATAISQVFTGFSEIDDDFYDELEESGNKLDSEKIIEAMFYDKKVENGKIKFVMPTDFAKVDVIL